jgi:hypothetical protein
MFIIDDETGKIKMIVIQEEPVSQKEIDAIIKFLVKNQKEEND